MVEAVAAMFLHDNALNTQAFPSLAQIQSEVVGITADLLHGDARRRLHDVGRHREHPLRGEGGARAGQGRARHHRTGDGPARQRPRCLPQGRLLLRSRGERVPVERRLEGRRRRRRRLVGPNTVLVVGSRTPVPAGRDRPDPGARGAGPERRRAVPHRCLHGWLRPAIARKPLGPFVDPAKRAARLPAEGRRLDRPEPVPRRRRQALPALEERRQRDRRADVHLRRSASRRTACASSAGATTIEKNDVPWEASVVEGPMLWKHDGRYFLFYSGNVYSGAGYAVGYATCDSPLGPCKDAPENPILKTACGGARAGAQRADRRRRGPDLDRLPRVGRRLLEASALDRPARLEGRQAGRGRADVRRAGRAEA